MLPDTGSQAGAGAKWCRMVARSMACAWLHTWRPDRSRPIGLTFSAGLRESLLHGACSSCPW